MPSATSGNTGRQLSSERRSNSWDRKSKAIVYDPSLHELKTERCEDLNSKRNPLICRNNETKTDLEGKSDSFEVHLPRWRNRVDIYVDPEARSGFVASIQLDKLKWTKNWQRRLGRNYKVLHVRGLKPGTASRTSSRSSASIPIGK